MYTRWSLAAIKTRLAFQLWQRKAPSGKCIFGAAQSAAENESNTSGGAKRRGDFYESIDE
jgi:hypothetical protein